MNLVTLNVKGPDDALFSLQQSLPIAIDSAWRKGDRRRSGALREASGFSAIIADAANPREIEERLGAFIAECVSRGIIFGDPGVEAQLSFGVTVGDSQQFVVSIDLPRALLSALAACGVSLSFTAYPTSDEANAAGSI
jgi:hypothetical protein